MGFTLICEIDLRAGPNIPKDAKPEHSEGY